MTFGKCALAALLAAALAGPCHATYGDADGDGKVTLLDARMVVSYALGRRSGGTADLRIRRYGDVDPVASATAFGDGQITLADGVRVLRRAAGLETDAPAVDYWPLDAPTLNPVRGPIPNDAYAYADQSGNALTANVPATYACNGFTVRTFKQSDGGYWDVYKDTANDLYLLKGGLPFGSNMLVLTFSPPIPLLHQRAVAQGQQTAYEGYTTGTSDAIGAHDVYYDVNVMGRGPASVPAAGALPFDDTLVLRLGLGISPSAASSFTGQQAFFFWLAPCVGPVQMGRAATTWSAAPDPAKPIFQAKSITINSTAYPTP